MRRWVFVLACLACDAGRRADAPPKERKAVTLELQSAAFADGGTIPQKFSGDGPDVSPALSWTGVPGGARAFALIMDDPDAPVGTWVHWVLYDLPATRTSLPEAVPKDTTLPSGAKQGKNSWGKTGYGGPAPPPGPPHRYYFKLYALSAATGLPPRATKEKLLAAMKGKVLAEAQWMGRYGR